MRFALLGIGLLLVITPAEAQVNPCLGHTLGFDPYKPSDAAVIRQYGGAVMSQVPLTTLLRLDPYVPSQAELLRQVGNGIPAWMPYWWYPAAPASPAPAGAAPDCAPAPQPESAAAAPLTSFAEMIALVERHRDTTAAVARPTTAPRRTSAERNRGLTIHFAGRSWTSAGAAVPFRESDFTRAGDSNGFPVYRLSGDKQNVIYVPMTPGMVAPFRPVN